jgi:hypothetical protein
MEPLPDLTEIPTVGVEKPQYTYDEETALLEAATEGVDIEKGLEEMAKRAEVYQERLENLDGKKERPTPVAPPDLDVGVTERKGKETGGEEKEVKEVKKESPKQKPKKNFIAANKARLTLAAQKGKGKAADIKPIEGTVGVPKKPVIPENPPSQTLQEEREEEQLWGTQDSQTTPKLGDEGFPTPSIPNPSDDYVSLSQVSDYHESVADELSEMAAQIRNLVASVSAQNVRLASVEKRMEEGEEDRSQFISKLMDRIRSVERQLGNKPPSTTPASSATLVSPAPAATTTSKTDKTNPAAYTVAELLARRRKQ